MIPQLLQSEDPSMGPCVGCEALGEEDNAQHTVCECDLETCVIAICDGCRFGDLWASCGPAVSSIEVYIDCYFRMKHAREHALARTQRRGCVNAMRYCIHDVGEFLENGEKAECAECDAMSHELMTQQARIVAELRERLKKVEAQVEDLEAKAFHATEDANAWSAIAIRFEKDSIRLMKALIEINSLESRGRGGDASELLELEARTARIELKQHPQIQNIIPK